MTDKYTKIGKSEFTDIIKVNNTVFTPSELEQALLDDSDSGSSISSVSVGANLTGDGTIENPISLGENVTVQGNTFNEANKLVKLDAEGKIPTNLYNNIVDITTTAFTVVLNGIPITQGNYLVSYNTETKIVTIQHNLNCRVLAMVFDSTNKQVFIGVDYIDNNSVKIEFTAETFPNESLTYTVCLSTGSATNGILVAIKMVDELPDVNDQITGVLYLIPESLDSSDSASI